MPRENRKVSYDFSDNYKNLPLNMRIKVNVTAVELLEIQKKNDTFPEEEIELVFGEDREKRNYRGNKR